MLTLYLKKLIQHHDLTQNECQNALDIILTAQHPEQIAAFLVLMRAKGETAPELFAFVQKMQEHQINITFDNDVLDIVGTGGDGAQTANISTAASILAASCEVPVLKHGNRAVSSQAGSADVLEALGLTLQQTPQTVIKSLQKNYIGFCFAPSFHPILAKIKPIRSALKIPTFFNLLGPLLNPAQAKFMLLGVFDAKLQAIMADILIKLKVKRAMVVHGNGLDELNCLGPCDVIEIKEGNQIKYQLNPEELGLPICKLSDLIGGNSAHNAQLIKAIVNNVQSPLANTVILNAAAAIYIYGKVSSIKEGITLVRENIKNGKAQKILASFTHA